MPDSAPTIVELAADLRALRTRRARATGDGELTVRQIAASTGYALGTVSDYLTGTTLPPTDRFGVLVRLLGATPAEEVQLGRVRDLVEQERSARREARGRVLRELPPEVFGFAGRERFLAALDGLVDGPRYAVVSGPSGVGRTAAVVRWAHRRGHRFPDGAVYVDLRGRDSEVRPKAPGRRSLLVLDNVRSAEHARPLLAAWPGRAVVITGREFALRDAIHLPVPPLTAAEALDLLTRLTRNRPSVDQDAAAELVDRCARLPLALRLAAEVVATKVETSVQSLVAGLAARQRGVGDVRGVLAWTLSHQPPELVRAFRLVVAGSGRRITPRWLASAGQLDVGRARAQLDALGRAQLLHRAKPGHYGVHELVRACAGEPVRRPGAVAMTS